MKEKFYSRKLAIAAFSLFSSFILALLGKLSAEYASVVSVVCGAYSFANAYTTGHGNEAGIPPIPAGLMNEK